MTGQDIKVPHDQENDSSLKPPDWPFPHGLQTPHLAQRQTGVVRILLQFVLICHQRPGPLMQLFVPALLDFLHTKHHSWISCAQNNVHGFCAHNAKYRPYLNLPLAINQSIFYVCSHQGDIRQKQPKTTKHIIIIYTHFPTELGTIDLTFKLAFKLNC